MNDATLRQFYVNALAANDEHRVDLCKRASDGDALAEHAIEVLILIDDRDKWRELAQKLAPERTETIDKAVKNEREGCARLAARIAVDLFSERLEDKFTELDAEDVRKRIGNEIRKRGE